MAGGRAAGIVTVTLLVAFVVPFVAAPSIAGTSSTKPVTLAYRYAQGEVIRQTTRQMQSFNSESRPDLAGESVTVTRSEARVLEADPNGSALLDETTSYEADDERRDHRRFRTTRTGRILWVDIISGEPSALQGGALFLNRPVRAGESWNTRMKGWGGGPSYTIDLVVKLDSITGSGYDARAELRLSGRMDAATVTAMLGSPGIAQGIRGKECRVSGGVVFRVGAGKESSSRLNLDCDLEMLGDSGPSTPAVLHIVYETTDDGPSIPAIPAP